MNEISAIARTAKANHESRTKTREDYLVDLEQMASRLEKFAVTLPVLMQHSLIYQAGIARMYHKIIRENSDVGPMTYWSQMRDIERIALTYEMSLNKVEQKQEHHIVDFLREFRELLFFTLQDDGIIQEDQLLDDIHGTNADAHIKYLRECEELAQQISVKKYPGFKKLWSEFKGLKLRETKKAIDLISLMSNCLDTQF